jgi:hypothetical protein
MMMGVTSLAARRRRQIDRPGEQPVQGLGVFCQQDFEAFLSQIAAEQVADSSVVVNNDNAVGALVYLGRHGWAPNL